MHQNSLIRLFTITSFSLFFASCLPPKPASNSIDATSSKISGKITVTPEIQKKLKPTDVLFIIARVEQVGPPTAVKRFERPTFPLQFSIGPEDAMMPGMGGFEAGSRITLAARLSRTGNAMPAVGDLEGVFKNNPATPGQNGVEISIDRERN